MPHKGIPPIIAKTPSPEKAMESELEDKKITTTKVGSQVLAIYAPIILDQS